MSLVLRPISIRSANTFVGEHHRHHKPPQGAKFALSLVDGDRLVGVALIGRPVARNLDDGWTAEVIRLCTDGTRGACSKLYSHAKRAAQAMGYRRVLTYILADETGESLRGAGWKETAKVEERSWDRPGRGRVDKHPTCAKTRWEAA